MWKCTYVALSTQAAHLGWFADPTAGVLRAVGAFVITDILMVNYSAVSDTSDILQDGIGHHLGLDDSDSWP